MIITIKPTVSIFDSRTYGSNKMERLLVTPREERPIHKAFELFDIEFRDTKDTVIIIDEIQESSRVFNLVRTLAREFDYYAIITGSYLGLQNVNVLRDFCMLSLPERNRKTGKSGLLTPLLPVF